MGLVLGIAVVLVLVLVAGAVIAAAYAIASLAGGVAAIALLVWGARKVAGALSGKVGGRWRIAGQTRPARPEAPRVDEDVVDVEPEYVRTGEAGEDGDRRAYPTDYVYVDEQSTPEQVARVMRGFKDTPVTGEYARYVMDTLDALEFRERTLRSEIDAKFTPRTISWDKFSSTVGSAVDAVRGNCALLARRVQTFDVVEYDRYLEFERAGGFSARPDPGKATLERWRTVTDAKREMDQVREATDTLMTELGKLSAEVAHLDSSRSRTDTADIIEEVSRLADETRLYR